MLYHFVHSFLVAVERQVLFSNESISDVVVDLLQTIIRHNLSYKSNYKLDELHQTHVLYSDYDEDG